MLEIKKQSWRQWWWWLRRTYFIIQLLTLIYPCPLMDHPLLAEVNTFLQCLFTFSLTPRGLSMGYCVFIWDA
jgi:hypothetical protein